jgi:hypothetical protein
VPATYEAVPEIHFVHPLLVKFSLHYTYVTGRGGPYFTQEFVVTPDLIVTRLKALQSYPFGLTVPLLENDGRPLEISMSGEWLGTNYPEGQDQQCFVLLNSNTAIDTTASSIKSTYGWLKPVKVSTSEPSVDVLIYPRTAEDPSANTLRESFSWTKDGFRTALGEVDGNLYRSEHAAGGLGKGIDFDQDGKEDFRFSQICKFFIQLEGGIPTAIEVDREVTVYKGDQSIPLKAFKPHYFQ